MGLPHDVAGLGQGRRRGDDAGEEPGGDGGGRQRHAVPQGSLGRSIAVDRSALVVRDGDAGERLAQAARAACDSHRAGEERASQGDRAVAPLAGRAGLGGLTGAPGLDPPVLVVPGPEVAQRGAQATGAARDDAVAAAGDLAHASRLPIGLRAA
jgi:hypothetical protein